MNVTPRRRARSHDTRWRLECGICTHAFEVELPFLRRMTTTCPNCGTGNVWNEPEAPVPAAPEPSDAPPPASTPAVSG